MESNKKVTINSLCCAFAIFIIIVVLFPANAYSVAAQGIDQGAAQTLEQQDIFDHCLAGSSNLSYSDKTGFLDFVGTDEAIIRNPVMSNGFMPPEQAARGYLAYCGSLFGLRNQADELRLLFSKPAEGGRNVVRFQQAYQGVPVFGAELNMQLNANYNVILVNGGLVPNIDLNTSPTISAKTAQQAALGAVTEEYSVSGNSATVSEPELWVFDPKLIGSPKGTTVLAWRVEVAEEVFPPFRQLVFVNANDGSIAYSMNQLDTAKNRKTYDMNNTTTYPGSLVCGEGQPNCASGDQDEKNAHIYAGDTYDFYKNRYGRDSLDNAGMILYSHTHYSSGYCNAFWDSLNLRMTYGDGCFLVVDDVVAHEMTHGVTDYESNLDYSYQSGAINESFSDIWGEFVDLTNGKGTDTAAVRWLMGEDSSGGAIRDMKNPPNFSDPDRMGSPLYYTGSYDNGGVHINSGVGNKAAFLITDGQTFNGYTITGIGINKTAKIYYEVQTNILTSSAQYKDLGNALYQACNTLIGKAGITAADCIQVQNATYATEMIKPKVKPVPVKPKGIIFDKTPTFVWTKVNNAQKYQFQVWKGTTKVRDIITGTAICGATNCNKTLSSTQMLAYADYKWRARAKIDGVWKAWSAYKNFTVQNPKIPAPISPKSTITDRTPTYKWTKVNNATAYRFQLWQGTTMVYTKTAVPTCGTATCTQTPSEVLGYKSFKWRVRAKVGGVWRPWSEYKYFIVAAGFNSQFTSNANGWAAHKGQWVVDSGHYKASPPTAGAFSSASHSGKYSTQTYEARMKMTGCTFGCTAHLSIRGTPLPLDVDGRWSKEYKFVIDSYGDYAVFKVNNLTLTPLKSWTYSANINTSGYNTVKVTASGNILNFYINGHLLWTGFDTDLIQGKAGIGFLGDPGSNLWVDWAKLTSTVTSSMDVLDESGQELFGGTDLLIPMP